MPSLPENWSDLPLRLTASETVLYNSNILGVPIGGRTAFPGQPIADFTSTTTVGASTRSNWGGQQVYFDASFGEIRYLREGLSNTDTYLVDSGVNWSYTSRCSGVLDLHANKSPSTITEMVGVGINNTTSIALNESGACSVSNGVIR